MCARTALRRPCAVGVMGATAPCSVLMSPAARRAVQRAAFRSKVGRRRRRRLGQVGWIWQRAIPRRGWAGRSRGLRRRRQVRATAPALLPRRCPAMARRRVAPGRRIATGPGRSSRRTTRTRLRLCATHCEQRAERYRQYPTFLRLHVTNSLCGFLPMRPPKGRTVPVHPKNCRSLHVPHPHNEAPGCRAGVNSRHMCRNRSAH